jgi:hypothetical protein
MAGAIRPRWKTAAAATLALLTLSVLVTACGKGQYTYVANQDDKAYFKVPSAWRQVDPGPLDQLFMGRFLGDAAPDSAVAQSFHRLIWSAAFDAAEDPTAEHLITAYPSDQPVTYSLIVHLPEPYQGVISFNVLRDLFLPVTEQDRAQAEQNSNGGSLPGFELLDDQTLTPGHGVRGVRVIYNYQFPGGINTYDLTSLTNDDNSVLYLLLMGCSTNCYRHNAVEFDNIATSFTVRSAA